MRIVRTALLVAGAALIVAFRGDGARSDGVGPVTISCAGGTIVYTAVTDHAVTSTITLGSDLYGERVTTLTGCVLIRE